MSFISRLLVYANGFRGRQVPFPLAIGQKAPVPYGKLFINLRQEPKMKARFRGLA